MIGIHQCRITWYLAIFLVLFHPFSYYLTLLVVLLRPFSYYFALFTMLLHPFTYYFALFNVLLHPFSYYFILLPKLLHPYRIISTILSKVARNLEDSITRTTGHLASATDASTMYGISQYIVAKVEYILENCAKYFLGFDICQEIIFSFKWMYSFLLVASNYLHSQYPAALFLLGK